jgi:hypothetical protein
MVHASIYEEIGANPWSWTSLGVAGRSDFSEWSELCGDPHQEQHFQFWLGDIIEQSQSEL